MLSLLYSSDIRVRHGILISKVCLAKLCHIKVEKYYLDQATILTKDVGIVLIFDVFLYFPHYVQYF